MRVGSWCHCPLLFVFAAALTSAQPVASPLDLACRPPNSAFDCAKAAREAVAKSTSLDEIVKSTSYWNDRFENEVVTLRSSKLGLTRSQSDMEMIKKAVLGVVPDEKDAAVLLAKHAPVAPAWIEKWKTLWMRYFRRVSPLLSSPVTRMLSGALKASMPSQIATQYDELLSTNKSVDDAVYKRTVELDPAPTFIDTIRDDAFRKAQDLLLPSFQPANRLP